MYYYPKLELIFKLKLNYYYLILIKRLDDEKGISNIFKGRRMADNRAYS